MWRDDARLIGDLPPAVARLLDWMFAPVATQATASDPASRDRRPAAQGAGELWSEHARGALFAPSVETSRDAPFVPMPERAPKSLLDGLLDGLAARIREQASPPGLLDMEHYRRARQGLLPVVPPVPQGEAGTPLIEPMTAFVAERPLDAAALAVSPVPFLGDVAGLANDICHYATEPESRTIGNYLLSVAGLLPFVPPAMGLRRVAGGLLGSAEDTAASSARVGYNPRPLPERPFHDDYPQMAGSGEQGRLAQSIDGAELNAPLVAGRRVLGGRDEGLTAEDAVATAERVVHVIEPASRRELGKDVGRYLQEYNPAGNGRRRILYRKDLKEAEVPRVIAHEAGHAIDEMAGQIDHTGLTDELNQVYHDLATGQQGRTRHRTLPKHLGYSTAQAPRELMAEAIRAYMVDPNYLKTVAPKTAARIRQYVNTNPRLSHVIQFNELGALLGAGAGLLGEIGSPRDDRT